MASELNVGGITTTGNVGIGTSSPNFELEVAGNIGIDEKIYHNDDHNTYIQFTGDTFTVRTGGTDRLVIDSTGLATFSAGIAFTQTGTAATGAATTSSTLDHYEEGTFTPTDGGSGGLTLTSLSGAYTRVGRLVTFIMSATYPTNSDSTNNAFIGGLPFATAVPQGGGFIRHTTLSSLSYTFPIVGSGIAVYTTSGNAVKNDALSGKLIDIDGHYYV